MCGGSLTGFEPLISIGTGSSNSFISLRNLVNSALVSLYFLYAWMSLALAKSASFVCRICSPSKGMTSNLVRNSLVSRC